MEKNSISCSRGYRGNGLFCGLLLVAFGLLFWGINCGVIPTGFRRVFISWPMAGVVAGVLLLCKRRLCWGALLLVTGIFFIMPRVADALPDVFRAFPADYLPTFWPMLLILLGLLLIFYWVRRPGKGGKPRCSWPLEHAFGRRKAAGAADCSDLNALFGNGEYIVLEPVFSGAKLNAVCGSITFDLTKTTLPEGDTVIDVNATMGSVVIVVPRSWQVVPNISPVLGEVADKRRADAECDSSRRLLLTGVCTLGNVEIHS
ncbi:MAG: cell wall-active antibiotics response protein [Prevotellaceae bacterium]|nr:cell wall-active antibiotics response protein [Prevotellaceae bacterium]